MEKPDASFGQGDDPDRRTMLTGLAATYLSSFISPAVAQPSPDAARGAFLAISTILTGRPSLDEGLAARLHGALAAEAPQFDADVQSLLALIEERRIAPDQLQQALDAEASTLAALPRKIVAAWYTGVVGDGERARCVTFETSLMYIAVADRLAPPSYCYGPYGSWVESPV